MTSVRTLVVAWAGVTAAAAGCAVFEPAQMPVGPNVFQTSVSLVVGQTIRVTCSYSTQNVIPVTLGWVTDSNQIATIAGASSAQGDCSADITGVSAGVTTAHFVMASNLSATEKNVPLPVIVAAGIPTITNITAPPSPVATVPFAFTVYGTNFDPVAAEVHVTGPVCNLQSYCAVDRGSRTYAPPNALGGMFTAPTSGQFTFTVRNGIGGAPSNGVVVAVGDGPAPVLTFIRTQGSAPQAQTAFQFSLFGTHFDAATAQVVVTGPGCAPSCAVAAGVTTLNDTIQVGGTFTAAAAGTYAFSVRNGPQGTFSNSLPLVIAAAPACASTVVIADAFEAVSLWTDSLYASASGARDSTALQATGGNPGGFRLSYHTIPANGSLNVIHRLESATYNPAPPPAGSGPIKHIDYAEDQIVVNPPFPGAAVASQFFIQQGGKFYFKALPAFSSVAWVKADTLKNLIAADFSPAGLDFGATGGVMRFGYARANSNTSLSISTRQHGIDNFKVTICQ